MTSFYTKFALNNIRKNKLLIVPYLLASTFTIAIYYIINSITFGPNLDKLEHGATATKKVLFYGVIVIAIFSIIFLFYTYSFLIKRRIKELGLYAVLGMTKRQIARVLLLETIFIAAISIALGLGFGILFDKLTLLGLLKLFGEGVVFGFHITPTAVVSSVILFGSIYTLILLYTILKISRLKIVTLLKESSTGEKEPKVRFILALLGLGLIGYGYYTALTVDNPLSALLTFFFAVVAVIIGTYFLFMAISIAILKLLKSKKNYYYKPKHFIGISGLLYRMKRNAVGLANICILSTMVLVTMGSTSTMYAGVDAAYESRYPRDISVSVPFSTKETVAGVEKDIDKILEKHNVKKTDAKTYTYFNTVTILNDSNLEYIEGYSASNLVNLVVTTLDEYSISDNQNKTLSSDEILLFADKKNKYDGNSLGILGNNFKIKEHLSSLDSEIGTAMAQVFPTYYVVVKDDSVRDKIIENYKKFSDHAGNTIDSNGALSTNIIFNINDNQKEAAIVKDINNGNNNGVYAESKFEGKGEFRAMFASFLFIGCFISLVFIVSQVVIMYYKQISEGYEDKDKFAIMKKVGLSDSQIKQSIRSQVLLIFFTPLIVAIIHTIVAFPFIEKIMHLFLLNNTQSFIIGMGGAIGVFAIFYLIVYVLTSRTYYKIINE